jgi:HrpA-like RNA helicase
MDFLDSRVPKSFGGSPSVSFASPADRILIIRSSTGSGKSTVMTAELYHRFQERTRKNIACTQPTVLTAKDIPVKQVAPFNTAEKLKEFGHSARTPLVLGKNIGFQTGLDSKKPLKGLVFMTIGVLLQQLNIMSDAEFSNKYSFIIIDEAHIRSTNTDAALYGLKRFVARNVGDKNCPFVIITSATFDPFKYADYLLSSVKRADRYKNIIDVRGMTFPVSETFLSYDSSNYLRSAVDTVIDIHTAWPDDFLSEAELRAAVAESPELFENYQKRLASKAKTALSETPPDPQFRDILVFFSGAFDIGQLKAQLNALNSRHPFFKRYPVAVLSLTSADVANKSKDIRSLAVDIKKLKVEVRDKKKKSVAMRAATRRVMGATPAAETGLTIDTLKFVVESGWVNSSEYSPNFGLEMLVNKPVTRGMHQQRKGRVGRKYPGHCYTLFTEESLAVLQENQYPDIMKEDIALDFLSLLVKMVDSENKTNDETLYKVFMKDRETAEKGDPLASAFEIETQKTKIDLYKLDLLDKPSADSMHAATEKLFALGAINSNSIPTPVGFVMNRIRKIRIESIRMVLAGYAWKAPVIDLVTIAVFLEAKMSEIFPRALEKNREAAIASGVFTMFPKSSSSVRRIKEELYVADDFVAFAVLYDEFRRNVGVDLSKGKNWCESVGVSYQALLKIAELRDEIVNNLAVIGMNPYENKDKAAYYVRRGLYSDAEKMEYVKSMKQCIFEGYKLNLAVWDNSAKDYKLKKSRIPLKISSKFLMTKNDVNKFGDSNPRYLAVDRPKLTLDPKTNMYNASCSCASVMDGFVAIDVNFSSIV